MTRPVQHAASTSEARKRAAEQLRQDHRWKSGGRDIDAVLVQTAMVATPGGTR